MKGTLTKLSETRWKYRTSLRTYYLRRTPADSVVADWNEKGEERSHDCGKPLMGDDVDWDVAIQMLADMLDDGPPNAPAPSPVMPRSYPAFAQAVSGRKYSYTPSAAGAPVAAPQTNPVPMKTHCAVCAYPLYSCRCAAPSQQGAP